jgi:hypothetical protein
MHGDHERARDIPQELREVAERIRDARCEEERNAFEEAENRETYHRRTLSCGVA